MKTRADAKAYISPIHRAFCVDREGHPPTTEQVQQGAILEAERILAETENGGISSCHATLNDNWKRNPRVAGETVHHPYSALAESLAAFVEGGI